MTKRYFIFLLLLHFSLGTSVFAQKQPPVVDKETIKVEQQSLKDENPGIKVKTIKYDDGSVYIGEIVKRNKQGIGTMFYANGGVYRGEWFSDTHSGQGTMAYINGDRYIGEWRNGMYEGKGTMTYINGDKYSGAWHSGEYSGQGKMTYQDGNEYTGEWLNGKYYGAGTLHYAYQNNERIRKYEGNWKEGVLSGQAVAYHRDGLVQRGTWDEGAFILGEWVIDKSGSINGKVVDDCFVGQASIIFPSGYTYTGDCSTPMLFESKEDIINNLIITGRGILSKGDTIKLDGEFENCHLMAGNVFIKKKEYSLLGEYSGNSFTGEFSIGNEKYKGIFTSKDQDGFFHQFSGLYRIKGSGSEYVFDGTLDDNKPMKGELMARDVNKTFAVEYDEKEHATVSISGAKNIINVHYETNEGLFSAIIGDEKTPVPTRFTQLEGKYFSMIEEHTPLPEVNRKTTLAFFPEGIVYRYVRYDEAPRNHEYKTTPNRTITCPSCHGAKYIEETGYHVDGQAYKKTIICPLCNGKGKTDSELANILNDGLDNFWSAVGTIHVLPDGRTPGDFINKYYESFYKFSISDHDIHIEVNDTDTNGETDFVFTNGKLYAKHNKTRIMPVSDSSKDYEYKHERVRASAEFSEGSTLNIEPLQVPFLPFSFTGHPTVIKNTSVVYVADELSTRAYDYHFSSSARVIIHEYDEGQNTGVIDFDRELTSINLGNERSHSLSYNSQSSGGLYIFTSDSAPIIDYLQLPASVSRLIYYGRHKVKTLLLTSKQPPKVYFYERGVEPSKDVVFLIPEQYINEYKNDEYWKSQRLKPIRPNHIENGRIVTEALNVKDVLFTPE